MIASPIFETTSLSVVIPAYNEQQNIRATLTAALASLRRMVGQFEIIVVDDCSRDETGTIAAELRDANREIVVLRNETNLGQGGSLQRGFQMARYDLVTHNGMDYPFHFDDLGALLSHFPDADVVVAARRAYPGTSAGRRLISLINRVLIGALFGTRFRDYNFVQIYKRSLIQTQPSISQAPSFITPEKIIRAVRDGRHVIEVPVDYHPRSGGTPSSASIKNIRRALRDMTRLWIEFRRGTVRVANRSV